MSYSTWDIEDKVSQDIKGGLDAFSSELRQLKQQVQELLTKLYSFEGEDGCHKERNIEEEGIDIDHKCSDIDDIKQLILKSQSLYTNFYQLSETVICLRSIDQSNERYGAWMDEINVISGIYQTCKSEIDKLLAEQKEEQLDKLLSSIDMTELKFILNERIQQQRKKLAPEMEKAFQLTEAPGLHAWGDLYALINKKVSSKLLDRVIEKEPANRPTLNTIRNSIYYGEDRLQRIETFELWKEVWQGEADLSAAALNHIAGYRLSLYESRGYESILEESLLQNRISESSVTAMWQAVNTYNQPLIDYLKRKGELFQTDKLSWSDQLAPLSLGDGKRTEIGFEEAISFITNQIQSFDQEFADFIVMAAEKKWIDARVINTKSIGAFCASFPKWGEPRVMMSFFNDLPSVGVLAHELGHAYQYSLMYNQPMFLQDIPPTVAELSSTLTETLVMRQAVHQASSVQEKIQLLDYQIIRDIGTILNTYVRYLFEVDFYHRRKQGFVPVEELNELMLNAQKKGFAEVFDSYEPTFWASLRHFYMTSKPFVHYPYTVAHLLSTGMYSLLMKEKNGGELLRRMLTDSSRLSVEEIGLKHLGVDIQQESFWKTSLDAVYENVALFLELTHDMK
ncbi:M3 family metallopeptidase [Bacillus horti]|uniref:Oligoendopeptidase F n=1 Tax=Caldalkalibacillus horti TaxID=77523 RepID=A0ABT9W3J1_9BACI|nr:M3 family metallopeptidase [Bacillus horti]MDQ0167642.1 oligoendopeptidase F [Bacillus horti]